MASIQSIFFSNKVEILYSLLKQKIFSEEIGLFSRRLIIVPSPAVKSWLMLQLAQDPDVGIASGIEVAYLDQSIGRLSKMEQAPSLFELTLVIENELREIVKQAPNKIWEPLFHYLKIDQTKITRKTERRIAALAQELANLFRDYGLFGQEMVAAWEKGECLEWQAELWRRIYSQNLQYPSRHLKNVHMDQLRPTRETHIYLFSISYIPKIAFEFLNALAAHIPISIYHLSPCIAFWSDIKSDKESHWICKYWQKRGIRKSQEEALDHYLRDRNSLLANFGKVGREMAEQIEELELEVEAVYALPDRLWKEAAYQELLAHELIAYPLQNLSALEMAQADMVLLRNPGSTSPVVLAGGDRSIQVHGVCSKWREVQVVYDLVMSYIADHLNDNEPLKPQDVIIMAPDIMHYVPYIHSVFGSSESQLEYHVLDMSMPSQNQLVQAFLLLIDLPLTRWDVLSLLQLFDYSCFKTSLGWGLKEMAQIRAWISELHILWGEDAQHRKELLDRDYSGKGFEGSGARTWEWGFDRLIHDALEGGEIKIAPSQLEFAGQWIALLRKLKNDLKILSGKDSHTLLEWAEKLTGLAEKYLSLNEKEEDHVPFLEQMQALRKAHRLLPEARFPFTGLRKLLRQAFERERMSFRETQLHAVRFCSMLPMRAIPAKAIILMGMKEGAFPHPEPFSSLNMMKKTLNREYAPTAVDYDRYLFLEALLSARKYFAVTYQHLSETTGKEQLPSLLITELLSYLDQACSFETKGFTETCQIHHPFHDYDALYFSKESAIKTYSKLSFAKGRAYYHQQKNEQYQFISSYEPKAVVVTEEGDLKIPLRQLAKLAKNPIKFYLNHSLGVYLREEDQLDADEPLTLSSLDTAVYTRKSLYQPVEEVLNEADEKGKLPPIGLFKEVARIKIIKGSEELGEVLRSLKIKPESVFSIEFDEKNKTADCSGEIWKLPALKIPYKNHFIVINGVFNEVSPQGLILHKNKSDVAAFWPEAIVFNLLVEHFTLPLEKNIVLSKERVIKKPFYEDPLSYFYTLVEYYIASLNHPSPLLPEMVPTLIKDSEKFAAKIEKFHENERNHNEEWLWVYRHGHTLNGERIAALWKEKANAVFGDAVKEWT